MDGFKNIEIKNFRGIESLNLLKDADWNYENAQHWDLDAEYLETMREFLKKNIVEEYE